MRPLVLSVVPYDDAVVQALVAQVQDEYRARYHAPDETPVEVADFAAPRGSFLLARDADGAPVGCGGWRRHGDAAELKRMYVVPAARRLGVARVILRALESGAGQAGTVRVELVTGTAQTEALSFYRREGYTPVRAFGLYAGAPDAVFLGKALG